MRNKKRLNALGKKIRNYRIDNDLSQEQLAERVGMSREHISCIERGKNPVNISNLYNIADALCVYIKNLL